MKKTSKKYTKLKLLTFLLLSLVIFFSLFPIDITNRAGEIISQLENKFDGKIEIKRALLYPLPYPRIRLEDFKVTNGDGAFLSTKKIKINLDLLPLITKKIILKKLTFIEADIVLEISKNGQLKLQGQKSFSQDSPETKLPPISIENSSFTIIDQTYKEGFAYSMTGITANLRPIGTDIKFDLEGYGTNEGLIQVTGNIENKKNKTTLINGFIDAKHIDIEPFEKYFNIKNNFAAKKGIVSILSTYELSMNSKGTEGFMEGNITYNNLHALIPQAISKDFISQSGSLDIIINRKNSKTNTTLKNIHAELEGFSINGNVIIGKQENDAPRGLKLELNSTPMPVSFAKDIQQTIKVSQGTKIWTNALNLKGGHIEFKNLDFFFDFEKKAADLTLEMDFQDAVLGYKRVAGDFTDVWGVLLIKSKKDGENTITLKNLTAISDKSAFTLNGQLRDFSTSPYMDMEGSLHLGSNIIEPIADAFNFELPVISKTVNVTGTFKGPIGELELKTEADFTDTGLVYRRIINKPAGFPLIVKTLMSQEKNSYHIKEGLISFGDSSLNINGLLQTSPSQYRLAITSENASIKDIGGISSYIIHSEDSEGTVTADLSLKRVDKNGQSDYQGKLSGKNLNFTSPMLEYPVQKTEAVVRLNGNSASIVLNKGQIGKSIFSGKADILDIDKGLIDFNLISPYLNIEDIIPKSSGVTIEPYFTGSGTVSVKVGHGLGLSFQNFSTTIDISKDEVNFPITNMQSSGGFVNGKFTYFRSYMSKRMFKTTLKAEKIDIKTMLKEFGMKEDVHSGEMEVELCITAKKGMEKFTTGLNGYMEIDAKDGKLEKLVLISKVMALFSPLAYDELFQSGFPYDKLTTEVHIKDGIFKTEDLHIKSNAMRLTGIGKINSNNGTIDMILAAHPFTTIDLLRNIPGGSIILGDGFMSVYYKAKGPVLNPKIKALQTKSLEKFTIDIIKRIYTVPRDAFRGKKELKCE